MKFQKSLFVFAAAIMVSHFALDHTAIAETDIRVDNITITGETMSVEDYKLSYTGPVDNRKEKFGLQTYRNTELQINSINIVNDEIMLDYEIEGYHTSLSGLLYNSSRKMDNIVAVFEDDASDHEVLFFEIAQGTQEINLLYNTELNGKPHMKFYFLDSQNNIYLFETALPQQFLSLTVCNTEFCDVYDDYLWYVNIVDAYDTQTAGDILYSTDLESEAIIKRNIAIAANQDVEHDASVETDMPKKSIIGIPKEYLKQPQRIAWGKEPMSFIRINILVDVMLQQVRDVFGAEFLEVWDIFRFFDFGFDTGSSYPYN